MLEILLILMALFPTILTHSAIQPNSTICISNNIQCGFYPVSPHLTSVSQTTYMELLPNRVLTLTPTMTIINLDLYLFPMDSVKTLINTYYLSHVCRF